MKRIWPLLLTATGLVVLLPLLAWMRPTDDSAPRPIGLEDVMHWQGIAGTALSEDGAWFAYRQTSLEGDGEAIFRQTAGSKLYQFNLGEEPENAGRGAGGGGRGGSASPSIALASDGGYGAFLAYPTHAEAEGLRRQHKPIETHAGVVNLASGEKVDFARVRRFAFSGEENPGWIALQKLAPAGDGARGNAGAAAAPAGGRGGRGGAAQEDPRGSDLILRELATGEEINIGNVGEFAFDRTGRHLAFTINAADRSGDGIQIRDMRTGALQALDSDDKAVYSGLGWNWAGTALAALKGVDDAAYSDKRYSVLGFTGFGTGAVQKTTFSPADAVDFPAGMTVSPDRNPVWSEDLSTLLFGIHAMKPVEHHGRGAAAGGAGTSDAGDASDSSNDTVDLVIWNYQDQRLQSQQIVDENQDRNYSYLAEYRVGEKKFLRLADDTVREVAAAPRQRFAIGRANNAYELDGHLDGQTYNDIYVINLATGERTLALKKARWLDEPAPDGIHFAYYEDGNYWVYNMATGEKRNLTAGAATSFVNTEDDHNVRQPPVPLVGWSRDSRALLLSDNWDIWEVPLEGKAVNLTRDGKTAAIRYRHPINFDPPGDPATQGFDLSRPLYLEAYGEWTKKDGLAVIEPGAAGAHRLMFDEAYYAGWTKALKADVYIYTRQTFADPPDEYAIRLQDSGFEPGTRLTDLGAQQKPFLWSSGTMLVNYTSLHGDKLQGALHLPANYEKGKQYPMVVEFYEKMSQNAYQYIRPTANGFSISLYTSNGYAVFDPDIAFQLNDPGISSSGCLVPAVKAAIATGLVDPARVGIHGHSWGGYQTAFAITQTHLFAAAMAGAPLTDMISMYGLIYKNTGVTNGEIFEASQGRFTTPPWDNWAAYTRNSPVANVKNVTTPLLMLADLGDGAVDFTQGMEYYNALRRQHKPVVLLDYPSQNHSLSKRADQKDYTIRMQQFFDHYLKGGPMPEWYAKGVPALAMDDYLKNFDKPQTAPAAAAAAGTAAAGGGGGGR